MPDERNAESRGEVDVAIAVGVEDVRALRFDPDDRIVVGARPLLAPLPTGGQRRALTCGEPLHPRAACRGRYRRADVGECISKGHAGCLARPPDPDRHALRFQG